MEIPKALSIPQEWEASQSLMEDGDVLGSFHFSLHRLRWEGSILPPGLSGRVNPSPQHPSLFCRYAFCVYWKGSAFPHCLQCLASTVPLSHATASQVSRCYLGICLPTLELGSEGTSTPPWLRYTEFLVTPSHGERGSSLAQPNPLYRWEDGVMAAKGFLLSTGQGFSSGVQQSPGYSHQ